PAAFALAMPSSCHSRRRFVSNSANTPSMSTNAFPAAVLVSIGCSVVRPFRFERLDDVLKVRDRTSEAIDAGDHEHVAFTDELQHRGEFLPASSRCTGDLLGPHRIAAGCREGIYLDRDVLICAVDAGVTVARGGLLGVSFGFRPR